MDSESFRIYGKQMVDFVADYWDSLDATNGDRNPLPSNIHPGFIWKLVPNEPPSEPENWENIFADLEPVVLAANTNWHHPNFFAYYPTSCNYASIIGDILSGGIASIGFTWKSSPSMTELEMAMTDWLAKAMGLPSYFLNSDEGQGGGIIQSTASDATFVALLSARARVVKFLKTEQQNKTFSLLPIVRTLEQLNVKGNFQRMLSVFNGKNNIGSDEQPMKTSAAIFDLHDSSYFNKLVAYCSDQAHSSVDKGIMLCGVKMRKLPTHRIGPLNNFDVTPEVLESAIKEDRLNGLVPFILVLTVGTTNTCAVESLKQLGPICSREKIWVHVDAAYAGSYLLCDEFRYLVDGIEFADSFNFNAHKALMVNFDCSPMWFKNATEAIEYFNVDPVYLKHEHQAIISDYRHLQIALGRRFRALKIWFSLRALGIKKIQEWLRSQVNLASCFAYEITQNSNRSELFELFTPQHLGLVCFRLKGSNALNEALVNAINNDGQIHLVGAQTHGIFFLRFAVCSTKTTESNIKRAAEVISDIGARILRNESDKLQQKF